MRLDGWEERLTKTIDEHSRKPFAWGGTASGKGSDCFEMCMDVAKAMTGVDPYEDERGRYKTRMGALLRFKKRGFKWLADAYADVFLEIHPSMARRGDIGLISIEDENGKPVDCSVVVVGTGAIGKSDAGTIRVPVGHLKAAYKVG
ncbi:MAG: hypothetical protein JJ979_02785 [Roseibium sp.]|nr:hypothetical protein [Roseibium sp.]